MLLLSVTVSTPVLVCVLTGEFTLGLALIRFVWMIISDKHKEAMNNMLEIRDEQKKMEVDLKPLTITVAEHAIEIKTIKGELTEQKGWLGAHDQMIQQLHRKIADNKP